MSKKVSPRKKLDLGLLHSRLGHRYTISLMNGDTANVWKDNELRIYPYPVCTSLQISSMNKKDWFKTTLKPKATFKSVLLALFQKYP